jgi:dTMP kinase
MSGLLLSLEGVDGSGKSTQLARLGDWLTGQGETVTSYREPGGEPLAERIRTLLLDPGSEGLCDESELLLYTASRLQLLQARVLPDLAAGKVVLLDRFADSTTAYQGFGRGLPLASVELLNGLVRRRAWPRRTWWLDLDPAVARARSGGADRMERAGDEFFVRVRAGYAAIAAAEPERVRRIDAGGSVEEVFAVIRGDLEILLRQRKERR